MSNLINNNYCLIVKLRCKSLVGSKPKPVMENELNILKIEYWAQIQITSNWIKSNRFGAKLSKIGPRPINSKPKGPKH